MNKKKFAVLALIVTILIALSFATFIKLKPVDTPITTTTSSETDVTSATSEETTTTEITSETTETTETTVVTTTTSSSEEQVTYGEYYYSKDEVALYIHIYNELPGNYITKKEAKALGWSSGSLERYAPGKTIGGDRFGNYEKVLPEGDYHECDIDTLGKTKRGAKRIVFDSDGDIYYTEDHYQTFTQLY